MTNSFNSAVHDSKIEFSHEEVNFEDFLAESLNDILTNNIIKSKVLAITKDFVTVGFGYKSEGQIPVHEFANDQPLSIQVGDTIDVYLEYLEDSKGQVIVSKEKADKLRIWEEVAKIQEEGGTIEGTITSRIKGGLAVDIGIKAFLPGSQVDLRPVRNLDKLLGETFTFQVLKCNPSRGNVVLSRRSILEEERKEKRQQTLVLLEKNSLLKGYVKNITDYGLFIDLGGIDGLLHITDMTWGRVVHPSAMYSVGDEIEVIVLNYDLETEKVSLGLKQKFSNPWDTVLEKYPIGTEIEGKVVNLTPYGAFIEIEPGIEGLVHVSEMSWVKKSRKPNFFVEIGETVKAVIKNVEIDRRRISLSIRDTLVNPWQALAEKYSINSQVTGVIRNVTNFGVFVGLEDDVDGLVHTSDISWSQVPIDPTTLYEKDQEIEVKILNIDVENQRLSLGIKQTKENVWEVNADQFEEGNVYEGKIVYFLDSGMLIELKPQLEGFLSFYAFEGDLGKNPEKIKELHELGSTISVKVKAFDPSAQKFVLQLPNSEVATEEKDDEIPTNYESVPDKEDIKDNKIGIWAEAEAEVKQNDEAAPAEEGKE